MLTALLVLSLHAEPTLTIVAKNRVTLEVAAVEKLGLQKADWKEKGVAHVVEGVPLEKVLAVASWGVDASDGGVKNKHASWRQVLLAKASDGYSAVFSSGEVSPSLGATRVLVVTRQDGAPLSGKLGRFRLVVLSDLEPARSLFSLESLELKEP
jgi:hypothetical protein